MNVLLMVIDLHGLTLKLEPRWKRNCPMHHQMFDSFIAALQNRRDSLLAKSEEHCTTKLKVLWSEKDHLENKIAKLNTTLRFSERIRLCSDTGEFLALSFQALRNLKELRDCSWESETVKEIDSHYLTLEKKTYEPKQEWTPTDILEFGLLPH